MLKHPFEALYNEKSKILILGSFPSVKSREQNFFYGHPQNRFWKVISAIFNKTTPGSISQKKNIILENRLALWDVIASCDIDGSSDSSITNVVANDLSKILSLADIEKVCCNGTTAYQLYQKYSFPKIGIKAIKLPSTSPANAVWNLERLIEEWKKHIRNALEL